jgi:hypothetical protein
VLPEPRRIRSAGVLLVVTEDVLLDALDASVWDRFGSFAGQPPIAGAVVWVTAERRAVIEGRRVDQWFEELV